MFGAYFWPIIRRYTVYIQQLVRVVLFSWLSVVRGGTDLKSTILTKCCICTGCPRMNGQNVGRVFLMLKYTDITQNTYIQSWTVTEIMAIEKCGLLGCPRTVRRPWRHIRPLRMPGNETPLANIVMQWLWRDKGSATACVKYLET